MSCTTADVLTPRRRRRRAQGLAEYLLLVGLSAALAASMAERLGGSLLDGLRDSLSVKITRPLP